MPKRQNRRKVATPSVQGDDSYVIVTFPHVSEIEDIMKAGGDFETFEQGSLILARHIQEWNWVDDEDESMVCPNGDGDIEAIKLLTTDEYRLLIELLLGNKDEKKRR